MTALAAQRADRENAPSAPASAEPAAPLIEVREASLTIGGNTILEHADIAVAPREIVSLIGPNGAGKTTMLRILLGLQQPDSGTVVRRPGLRIGYVPQKVRIEPTLPLTVSRFMTLTRRADRASVTAALARTGVAALGGRALSALSGGEFQRVLIARALLSNPELLVLDEPAQGVDVTGQRDLYNLIGALRDELGCGVLVVSHDLHLVMASTERVVCLNTHVCCTGHPETVRRDPAYLTLFGASTAEAFAPYAHSHDHAHGPGGEIVGGEKADHHGDSHP